MRLSLVLAVVVAAIGLVAPSLSAPAPVTIAAQPTDLRRDRLLTLFGTVASDRAKELVRIEARDCGQALWRVVAHAETTAGGRWSWPYFTPGITASIRAHWKGRTSRPVRVRDRAYVELRRHGARTFAVSVRAKMSFVGRRTLLQHFDPARGWRTVASAALTESGAPPGSSYVFSTVRLRADVPSGALVRASFPLAQARPCYLAGRSNMLRLP